jgi:hypothetical protein
MAGKTVRVTLYLEPDLHEALRLKAADVRRSRSRLVNDALRIAFEEDAADLAAFDERAGEPLISYEALLAQLNLTSSGEAAPEGDRGEPAGEKS